MDGAKKTIMIVEDDSFVMDIYETKIGKEGMGVIKAVNGAEAIKKLEEGAIPDLILLDIIMPYMDGLEVLKKIKMNDKWNKIPVVLLTNLSQKEEIQEGFSLGAKDYLIKSIVPTKKLIESLRRIMVFTKEPSFKIVMSFSKNILSLESKTPDLGEAVEEIEIESSSDEKLVLGVNAQYLMDSVKDINSLSVEINLTGQMSPLSIVPENDDNSVSVIMPIQIKNVDN